MPHPSEKPEMTAEPIAIIGTGCRFPGDSTSPSRLWKLIRNPHIVASEPPNARFDVNAFYHETASFPGTTNTRESYFLAEDPRPFDAPFFNISALEAQSIDPQQRQLLETVFESIEAAGLRMDELRGSFTGIFCGVMSGDWGDLVSADYKSIPRYLATGVARSNLANRISYFFDWHGPSVAVDTACSSSLVALHQAVSALQRNECSVAIAAGTNLLLSPGLFITTTKFQMLSPTGRSRMWDSKADGYARGEGIASVVLKRLSDAVACGDPIECVIKATGVNQDGRTMGLTMPSSAYQLQLIESTYACAGLNPKLAEDRCQFFEAHGTGTLAGDPQEASAIYQAFFGTPVPGNETKETGDILHVGSIKTVIGHTEGTAGLAGLIKASLCIQNGVIPPNLLYEKLNPELEPFAAHLKVPTEPLPWPSLRPGVPRRVSVNSFGFGGTNAHVILESYHSAQDQKPPNGVKSATLLPAVLPFVFSATTGNALAAVLHKYLQYLQKNPSINLMDLAWTLLRRKSALKYRLTLWAPAVDILLKKIEEELEFAKTTQSLRFSYQRSTGARKYILGVFTGQGAQWPQMGFDLISSSSDALMWLQEMQDSLDQLPNKYRPKFSLVDELSDASSNLNNAVLSQALSVAVQIILVRFLSALGVSFVAVVGHSSGEIAAAYAAGLLSATDAIKIAYLRGLVVAQACSKTGQPGAMIAVGISAEDAVALCIQEEFKGRVTMAASNGPTSVTLSGDADVIHELEHKLKEEKKFTRILRVDKAYHSHHMEPCSYQYLLAMEECNIKPQSPNNTCWYSSVYSETEMTTAKHKLSLSSGYWKENMVNPVLFSQAIATALSQENSSPDLVIEVGPHPALKGPVQQIFADILPSGSDVPYIGLCNRGGNGVESFASAIGNMWACLGPDALDITSYLALFNSSQQLKFVQDLPTYPFDHSKEYCFQTRLLNQHLHHRGITHPLLGTLEPETADGEWRWRHYLRLEDLPWLGGHCVESQIVFPASGYLVMALEAVHAIAHDRAMHLLQLHDVRIHQAIVLPDHGSSGIETLFRLIQSREQGNVTTGTFHVHASTGDSFQVRASGTFQVSWGQLDTAALPDQSEVEPGLKPVDIEDFYSFLAKMGYNFSGMFKRVHSLSRKKDLSHGEIYNISYDDKICPFSFHPAVLDACFQTMLGALGAPDDGELYTLMVPTRIKSAIINPAFCGAFGGNCTDQLLSSDTTVVKLDADGISGDVDLFTHDRRCIIQFEGVEISPLLRPHDERQIFSKLVWGPFSPNPDWESYCKSPEASVHLMMAMEKISLLNVKLTVSQLTMEDRENLDWHRSKVVAWMDHILELTRKGHHPICPKEWLEGSKEDINRISQELSGSAAVDMAGVVGANMIRFLRGETSMLEEVRKNDVLTRFYKFDPETQVMNEQVGRMAAQIAFRFPRMKILEIGAGTGSATNAVLECIGRSYYSYTFTDISVGFFEEAQAAFAAHEDRFIYQSLDIDRDPLQQGFEEHSYDLIVAANCLHATRMIQQTMTYVRRLLKPGGYLILLEVTNMETIRTTFLVGGFEGWWAGHQDGRVWGPMLSVPSWEQVLKQTGFSGIDAHTMLGDPKYSVNSVIVSRAVDDYFRLLREPLAVSFDEASIPQLQELVILGGATDKTSSLASDLCIILKSRFDRIICADTPELVEIDEISNPVILSLVDLDRPCFQELNEKRLQYLQKLTTAAAKLLWVATGSEGDCPYLGMSKGWLRSLAHENKSCLYQYLNIDRIDATSSSLLASTLMSLAYTNCRNDYTLSTGIHTTEPELHFKDGVMRICRLHKDPVPNKRYVSARRYVHEEVELLNSTVCAIPDTRNCYQLHVDKRRPSVERKTNRVLIRTRYSTAKAIQVGDGFLHLVIGEEEGTGIRRLAFSEDHKSKVEVPADLALDVSNSVPPGKEAIFLKAVVDCVIASSLVENGAPNSSIIIHDAGGVLRNSICNLARPKCIKTHFITSNPTADEENTTFLHPRTSTRALIGVISENLSLIASFSTKEEETGSIFARIRTLLPKNIKRHTLETLFQLEPRQPKQGYINQLADKLHGACTLATKLVDDNLKCEVVTIDNLRNQPVKPDSLIDWSRSSRVLARVDPVTSLVTSSKNKTYILAGMAGDLGQSLCTWMVRKGARYVVLSSRSPNVDPKWIEAMAKEGAQVVPMVMDISNRASVGAVFHEIQNRFPPIGGVVHGALVLAGCLFKDTTLELMQKTFAAKVQGSLLLDEISENIATLDFFVIIGSLTGIVGNWSQSAYSAATGFQTSLIQQRRARGRVGSIIHPGVISGVGYIARAGTSLAHYVRNATGSFLLSERDLDKMFAEAILAGPPDSGLNPEIITGTPSLNPEQHTNVVWYENPMTWDCIDYCVKPAADTGVVITLGSMKALLESATSMQDVSEIISAGLTAKVRSKFNLSADIEVTPSTRLADLGMDSLVAVDLRTWFAEKLAVEIPLLQIMSGTSIQELTTEAASGVPTILIPNVNITGTNSSLPVLSSNSQSDSPTAQSYDMVSSAGSEDK
ncbi:hypothetical protein LOZ01_004717 [Ophidiomyces ophidiicola]|nr:hypothetical protein LOZ01_004717 [Ophidiomyces ophidiicola]KAI2438721.1 hypothetical protein LOZ19_003265 [Ophidiomyces ophidiicola]